jgi:hypothetical protein
VVVVVAVVPARTEHQITDAGESRLNSRGVRRSNRAWRLRLLAGRIGPFRTSRIESDASSHSCGFRGVFGACGVVVGTRGGGYTVFCPYSGGGLGAGVVILLLVFTWSKL